MCWKTLAKLHTERFPMDVTGQQREQLCDWTMLCEGVVLLHLCA